jgi:hypothetical protein
MSTFYAGDFNWDDYEKMAFSPSNYNAFGEEIRVNKEFAKRAEAEKESALNELSWGRGFRSLKDSATGVAKLPGSVMQGLVDTTFSVQAKKMNKADEITEAVGGLIQTAVSSYISNKMSGGTY